MSANDAVLELLKDALGRRARIIGKRMFGGVGVYLDGTFFAILDDGQLFFKTSEATRSRFESEGSQPFTYRTKSGTGTLPTYWRVPERLFDAPEELAQWALDAATAKTAAPAARTRKPAKRRAAPPRA